MSLEANFLIRATSQWFANLDKIKESALSALQDVHFVPSGSRTRLESFVRGRSEWCISRQRVWGVPIPALYHLPTGKAVLNAESLAHIVPVLKNKGVQHWWEGPVEDFVPSYLRKDGEDVASVWKKGTDTMDVWFDSGSSWSLIQDLVEREKPQEKRLYLADVCVEGSDQHRGWFQSQLLTAIGTAASKAEKKAPYGALITHGMVLDEKGKKMSKSVGNIVSPITVLEGGKVCFYHESYWLAYLGRSCIRIRRRNPLMVLRSSVYGRQQLNTGETCHSGVTRSVKRPMLSAS